MQRCALAAAVVLLAALGAVGGTDPAGAAAAGLEVVGRDPLGGRGMNAALAIAGGCAYIGSRNDAPVQVLDISNPAAPVVTGALPAHPGSTPRELRAVASRHLLVVLYYRLNGGINGYDVFHWDSACASPQLVGQYDFGALLPHEFYLWQDPASPVRILLYTTFFASGSQQLQVIDLTDPTHPTLMGGWAVPAAYGHAPVHSIALAAGGLTAYISLWTGGLVVADVSDFAAGRSAPAVRPLTSPGAAFRTPPGNVHSAVALADGTHVLTTDERYPSPYGTGCPFGPAHIVDIHDPARPVAVAVVSVPENDAAACAAATRGTWTSHNPTLTAHLAFISWYSAGLQVFQLDDPAQPVRVAEFRPTGVSPTQRDLQLGITDSMAWSYPVLAGGLVYVADINQGLLVLRYTGPHQDEVAAAGFAEGNSNVKADLGVAPAASPTAPAPTTTPTSRPRTLAGRITPANAELALLAIAVVAVLGVVLRRRRGR